MRSTHFVLHMNRQSRGERSFFAHDDTSPAIVTRSWDRGVCLALYGSGFEIVQEGSKWLIAIGRFNVADMRRHLESSLRRTQDPVDVLDVARIAPGSFHLIYVADDGHRVHVQGPASGVRQTFFAQAGSDATISDRIDLLWQPDDAPKPNNAMLPVGLIHPGIDYGLTRLTYWQGVTRLFASERISWTPETELHIETYWKSPAAALDLNEAAEAVLTALRGSLSTLPTELAITADLSGGLDSTTLCCLMKEIGIPFGAYVEEIDDPNHGDVAWATKVARKIGADLNVIRPHDLPLPYDGIADEHGRMALTRTQIQQSSPYTIIRNFKRKQAFSVLLKGRSSEIHVSGFGADELFTSAPSMLTDLFKASPIKGVVAARNLAQLRRWKYKDVLRVMRNSKGYADWLEGELDSLIDPAQDYINPLPFSWGPNLSAPPWLTKYAESEAKDVLLHRNSGIRPQAATRALHTLLNGQRIGGVRLQPLVDLYADDGIDLVLPYMDDAVMEASIAIRPEYVLPGHGYKPLLKAAMKSVENGDLIERTTKGEFSRWVADGLKKNASGLARMFSDSALADLGYIDPKKLKQSIGDDMRPSRHTTAIELTIAAEVWARGH